MRRISSALTITVLAALPLPTFAHGADDQAKGAKGAASTEQHAFGVEGDPKKATRRIAISMDDSMQYSLSTIRVRQGETVTFVLSNRGKLMHELVIGTEDELRKHAELMRKNPTMEHDEPYMAHVKPGATERLTWIFNRPGSFMYGCLVTGHFEAGMQGRIIVADR